MTRRQNFRIPLTTRALVAFLLAHSALASAQEASARANALPPEKLALAFLAKEVPAWRPANRCFSCHNNGDGARALFTAVGAKLPVESAATMETSEFLTKPNLWRDNGPEGPFNDLQLARFQFTHALAAATKVGAVQNRQPLLAAADILVANQSPSGTWEFGGEDTIGSPVTYGRPLATAIALRILHQSDAQRFAKPIATAESWLGNLEPVSVLNAAAIVTGLAKSTNQAAVAKFEKVEKCLSIIRQNQTSDGGWGPYINSAPEPFDTAVVLCALAPLDRAPWRTAIQSGRDYLRKTQYSDGSWPETTRPPGQESYAQRIATTAWATIALIETREN